MKNKRAITVLGAGVSGLTTAITLMENGHKVEIFARELPFQSTSAVAAAIWFPFEVYPKLKVSEWSKISFHKYRLLSEIKNSGVSFIPFTTFVDSPNEPWWLELMPQGHILDKEKVSPVNSSHRGYTLSVPLIETPIYLKFLINRLNNYGVTITQKEINQIDELQSKSLIINCTGLGAKQLFGDQNLYPIQGQIVKVNTMNGIEAIATEYPMGKNGDEMAYIIPRKDCIVLGGSAKKNQYSTSPDPNLTNRILKYCTDFEPKISTLPIQNTQVGLRPGRTEIRLEKDPEFPVIHNYGHGGAGYTVSWGCAEEVCRLVQK